MTLVLRISQGEGLPAGQTAEKRLEKGRLVLGRGAESDWVLADPGRTISKRHCVIEEAELGYELTDLSINGVFFNDENEPVGVGNTRRLRHGDRIRIGPYRLVIELSGCERSVSPEPTSLGLAQGFDSLTELFRDDSGMLGVSGEPFAARPAPALSDLDRGTPHRAAPAEPGGAPTVAKNAFAPKAATAAAHDVPENWAAGLQERAPPAPPPPAAPQVGRAPAMAFPDGRPPADREPPPQSTGEPTDLVAPRLGGEQTLPSPGPAAPFDPVAVFCTAAGLDPNLLMDGAPEEIIRKAGEIFGITVEGLMTVLQSRRALKGEFRLAHTDEIFGITVEGLMTVLQSRRALKGEFRLAHTEFRPAENNPLKFSVDAQAAMAMLIGKPRRGFLPAREALHEAIADIRMHEVAVLAAMQEAWFSLLRRFDPKELSQRLEDDTGLAHLLGSKKARCWDAFITLYDSIAGNAADEWERTFQTIFGSAYERSMQKQRQRSG